MQEGVLDICGVPTKIITFGKWTEQSFSNEERKNLIVCIPGNPGVTSFYCEFLNVLHDNLGYPVWIIGHAGHDMKSTNNHNPINDNELCGLQGQINHKISFIETYVPKNAKVHFIGHSIGCHMILELLKIPSIHCRIVSTYLLFPAIEHLADTPNGRILKNIVPYFLWLLIFLARIFTLLPVTLQTWLIQLYMLAWHIPSIHLTNIIDFIHPSSIRNACYTAYDAIALVKEREHDVLMANKHMIKLYYTAADRWAPQRYFKNLKNEIPDIDAELSTYNVDHAFVLRQSTEVGELVAQWIKNR